jgi:aspartate racemase
MTATILMRSTQACIGILGGMGPRATVDLFQKLVEATPAAHDWDHIPTLVYSVPQIPDRTAAILHGGPSPLEDMCRGIRTLESAGASLIAVACNTAHYWFPEMQRKAYVPLVHIVDAVLDELRPIVPSGAKVGILGTSGTIRSDIYGQILSRNGFDCIAPAAEAQELVDAGIALVKSGRADEAVPLFHKGVEQLVAQGAGAIILACTEIPLVIHDGKAPVPTIDATAALARHCVRIFSAIGSA